jgi:hypothetical protein
MDAAAGCARDCECGVRAQHLLHSEEEIKMAESPELQLTQEQQYPCGCVYVEAFGRLLFYQPGFRRRCAFLLERGTKPECPDVLPLVREYYSQWKNGAGGSLHVVLDDGNVDDCFVDGAIGYALSTGDVDGMALGAVLRMMSKTQRLKLATDRGKRVDPGSSSG